MKCIGRLWSLWLRLIVLSPHGRCVWVIYLFKHKWCISEVRRISQSIVFCRAQGRVIFLLPLIQVQFSFGPKLHFLLRDENATFSLRSLFHLTLLMTRVKLKFRNEQSLPPSKVSEQSRGQQGARSRDVFRKRFKLWPTNLETSSTFTWTFWPPTPFSLQPATTSHSQGWQRFLTILLWILSFHWKRRVTRMFIESCPSYLAPCVSPLPPTVTPL